MPTPEPTRVERLTPAGAGAVSVILLSGDVTRTLTRLTGRSEWPVGRTRLVDLGGVDRGLAVRLAARTAWLMPHGGPAVTRAVLDAARRAAGDRAAADRADGPGDGGGSWAARWPEAADALEAESLGLMATATSPLAFELLAAQPARWRAAAKNDPSAAWTPEDAARSRRLDHLLAPPTVVLAGPPDIGKSTLANTLAGRTIAITADGPGTTRDAPSVRLDLDGLVATWHDAPGLRETEDELERAAIGRVGPLLAAADLLVAAADAGSPWPRLPRSPDLRVALRPDLGVRKDADLVVDGRDAGDAARLAARVRDALVPPADRDDPRPWDAAGRLRPLAAGAPGTARAVSAASTAIGAASASATQNPIDEMPQST